MIKDILVCLEGSPGTVRAIELALELAREHGARLVGLAIAGNGDRHDGVDEHRARFEARGQAVGVSTRILGHGQPAATILEEMTAHDLTILARGASFLVEDRAENGGDARQRAAPRAQAGDPGPRRRRCAPSTTC